MLRLLPQITPGFGCRCPLPTDLLVIVKGNLGMSLLVMRVQHAQHDSGRGFAQGPHKSPRQMKCNSAPFQSLCIWESRSPPSVQPRLPALSRHRRHSTVHPTTLTSKGSGQAAQRTAGPRHERHTQPPPSGTLGTPILLVKFSHLSCHSVSLENQSPQAPLKVPSLHFLLFWKTPCLVCSPETRPPLAGMRAHTYTEGC